jgi:hypothetical protein
MIKKPSAIQLESLSILENDTNFARVKEWLTESLEETLGELMTEQDEARMRGAQGSAKDLSEILKLANDARKIIDKQRR